MCYTVFGKDARIPKKKFRYTFSWDVHNDGFNNTKVFRIFTLFFFSVFFFTRQVTNENCYLKVQKQNKKNTWNRVETHFGVLYFPGAARRNGKISKTIVRDYGECRTSSRRARHWTWFVLTETGNRRKV